MENESFRHSNETRGSTVPAVSKAMRLIDAVANSVSNPGVSDLSRCTGLGKSTVHGLLVALTGEGLLAPSRSGKGYELGPRLIELGALARDRGLTDLAGSALSSLVTQTGETALFGRLEGDQVRILARSESPSPLKLSAPIGSTVPVLAGALGAAYLGSLPSEAAEEFLVQHEVPHESTRGAAGTPDRYAAAGRARERGFAVERGEYLPGILAAAATFAWLDDTYFVWVIGLDAARDEDDLDGLGRAVAATAEYLHGRLTESAPHAATRSA